MSARQYSKWLAVGTGVGIEIRGDDLIISIVRVRPNAIRVLATTVISRFRQRPAGEWGAECSAFLATCGAERLAAMVTLPRSEIIVRHLSLPGVAKRDLGAATRLQADSLHPYPEEEASFDWARVGDTSFVLIGIARTQVIDQYALLFQEAGIRVASFTFSAAVIYSAIRILSTPPAEGFVLLEEGAAGLEAYGESPARPLFSATFDLPPDRASALARAELRLDGDTEPAHLADLLPAPVAVPDGWDPQRTTMSYATAVAAACPWLALPVNLLPAGQRSKSSRAVYAPTVVLAAVLLVALVALTALAGVENRRYRSVLEAEIARYTPVAAEVRTLDNKIKAVRDRRRLLQEFRSRTKQDLDALQELTQALAPPAWLKNLQLTRSAALLNGEAPQAAKLLEILDKSPLFQNSGFTAPISRAGETERFTIRTRREVGPVGGGQ